MTATIFLIKFLFLLCWASLFTISCLIVGLGFVLVFSTNAYGGKPIYSFAIWLGSLFFITISIDLLNTYYVQNFLNSMMF